MVKVFKNRHFDWSVTAQRTKTGGRITVSYLSNMSPFALQRARRKPTGVHLHFELKVRKKNFSIPRFLSLCTFLRFKLKFITKCVCTCLSVHRPPTGPTRSFEDHYATATGSKFHVPLDTKLLLPTESAATAAASVADSQYSVRCCCTHRGRKKRKDLFSAWARARVHIKKTSNKSCCGGDRTEKITALRTWFTFGSRHGCFSLPCKGPNRIQK